MATYLHMAHCEICYINRFFSLFANRAKTFYHHYSTISPGQELPLDNLAPVDEIHLSKMVDLTKASVDFSAQLYHYVPSTYSRFFPSVKTNLKRELDTKKLDHSPIAKRTRGKDRSERTTVTAESFKTGFIKTEPGILLKLPATLEPKPCELYLVGKCSFGAGCRHVHKIFPKDYSDADIKIIKDHVDTTDGLSFFPHTQAVLDRKMRNTNA